MSVEEAEEYANAIIAVIAKVRMSTTAPDAPTLGDTAEGLRFNVNVPCEVAWKECNYNTSLGGSK